MICKFYLSVAVHAIVIADPNYAFGTLSRMPTKQWYVIAGPPSPPQGPLDVMDIYADRCALLWDTPKDDGGAPITHYLVEKCDQESDKWELVCDTDDLEIDVSDLTPGHRYQFRVAAVNSEGQSEFLATDGTVLAKDPWGECCSVMVSLLLYFDLLKFVLFNDCMLCKDGNS